MNADIDLMNNMLLESLDYYKTKNRPLKQCIIDDGFELLHNICIAHSPTKNINRSKGFNTEEITSLFLLDIDDRLKQVTPK